MTLDSEGMVLDNVSAQKSGRSHGLSRRAVLAWACCAAMKARG